MAVSDADTTAETIGCNGHIRPLVNKDSEGGTAAASRLDHLGISYFITLAALYYWGRMDDPFRRAFHVASPAKLFSDLYKQRHLEQVQKQNADPQASPRSLAVMDNSD